MAPMNFYVCAIERGELGASIKHYITLIGQFGEILWPFENQTFGPKGVKIRCRQAPRFCDSIKKMRKSQKFPFFKRKNKDQKCIKMHYKLVFCVPEES